MTPRVCVVSPLYHPSLGGVGRQAQLLAERLREAGLELFVISRAMENMPHAEFSPRVEVVRVPTLFPSQHILERKGLKELLVSLTFSMATARELVAKRESYEVAHFHGASVPLLVCLPVLKLMRKRVVAKVAAANLGTEAGSFKGRYWIAGGLLARLARMSDAMVAISDEIREGLLTDGFEAERVHRISNFVDEKIFFPASKATRAKLRGSFGQAEHTMVISSGRLEPRKGLETLLSAWQVVSVAFPRARLSILGEGSLRLPLESEARRLGISRTCSFMGRVDDVPDRLRAADVFVLPSFQEGMPNALLEAMASGLPSVGTRIGGVVDIVQDGENGLLAEPGDAKGLSVQVSRMLADAGERERLGAAGLATMRESFSLESRVDRYLKLYSAL